MKNLASRDAKVVWHPYTQMQSAGLPIPVVKGKGALLYDEKGKPYIDAISSWWVNLHGHAHPYIARKVSQQLRKLEQVIFAGFTHQPAIELAERLLEILPVGQSRVFYSDDGSTAVEIALKMAFQYWNNRGKRKTRVIALKNAYHGDTFGAMSVSERGIFNRVFEPFLFEVEYLEVGRAPRHRMQGAAAFIFEPLVQGAGGMRMYQPAWLDKMIGFCKQREILTIADEVMTGFGRTGKMFASDYLENKPDIICLSKSLTGGVMPLGVTTCTREIFNAFLSKDNTKTFFHGHSFTANPLACTAALASLDLLEEKKCRQQIRRIEKQHRSFVRLLRQHPLAMNLRIQGTIVAFEVKTDERSSYFNTVRDFLYPFFIERGVILRPLGNTIYIMPPYCIREGELERIYEVILDGLELLKKKHDH